MCMFGNQRQFMIIVHCPIVKIKLVPVYEFLIFSYTVLLCIVYMIISYHTCTIYIVYLDFLINFKNCDIFFLDLLESCFKQCYLNDLSSWRYQFLQVRSGESGVHEKVPVLGKYMTKKPVLSKYPLHVMYLVPVEGKIFRRNHEFLYSRVF